MAEARLRVQTNRTVLTEAVQRRATMARQADRPDIQNNAFYQIAFDAKQDAEAKKAQIAKSLTYAGTRELSRSAVKEFESFMEYMQSIRLEMQHELIKLTDTEVMGELKSIYDELNRALDNWHKQMTPFTEMLAAIYKLRTNDKTADAYREIKNDKAREVENARRREELKAKFETLQSKVHDLQDSNALLSADRAFFGLGGTKKSAIASIEINNLEMDRVTNEMKQISSEIDALNNPQEHESELGEEFAESKRQLAKLLDISSEEHQQRQKDMVSATVELLQTFKDRTGAGREHLARMEKQFERLKTANRDMGQVTAVLEDAVSEAEAKTQGERAKFDATTEGESAISKMKREDDKMAAEEHVKALAATKREVGETAAELTRGSIQINTGVESTRNQMERVRSMNTRGVASAAEQLNVVLQGVNIAALNEASEMGRMALVRMNEETNQIAQSEVIRAAMDTASFSDDLKRAIDELASYGEVFKTGSDITSQNMAEIRRDLETLRSIKDDVQREIKEGLSAQADVGLQAGDKTPKGNAAAMPFGLGQ